MKLNSTKLSIVETFISLCGFEQLVVTREGGSQLCASNENYADEGSLMNRNSKRRTEISLGGK